MTHWLTRLRVALDGRYTIERELGRGGMATVFLGNDLKHSRRVAIKVLKPELGANIGPDRFLREIRIVAGLTHPHILPLYDSGAADDLLYYIMPQVEGESLRELLEREGRLAIGTTRVIVREVADALSYAHSRGILHRDIKPDNVLLSGGHAFVADFGVAKAIGEATDSSDLTSSAIALGTPSYMAPEQAAADPSTDYRADLYALGVITYEMLTGRPPFTGRSRAQILAAHVTQVPQPVTELRPDCPGQLATMVMRCLEKTPEARPQHAEDIVTTLDSLPAQIGTVSASQRWGRRAKGRILIAGLVTFPLILFGAAAMVVPTATRAMLLTLLRRPEAALISNRVVVAPFLNQTGDTSLDALGPMTADWIGQGLSGVPGIEIVDLRTALGTQEVVRHIPWPLRARDQAQAMAREVSAGTLVSGAIYREGDDLLFQASIIDVRRGRLVRALAPVHGSRAAPSRALLDLQTRVAGSFVLASTVGPQPGGFAEPPSLEAYEEVYHGVEAYYRDDTIAQYAHFERAARLDTTYSTPLVLLAFARTYNFELAIADTVTRRAEQLDRNLPPAERAFLDHLEAIVRGDRGEAVRAARRLAELTPGSPESQLLLASAALTTRQPSLAIEALARFDPDRGLSLAAPFYWIYQAEASAELGDWERSLAMGRAGLRRFPGQDGPYFSVARALARLGRVSEMKNVLSAIPTRGNPVVEQARVAVQVWAELRASGRGGAADSLMSRYASLLEAVKGDSGRHAQFVRGSVLLRAGRLTEARGIFASLESSDTGFARLQDLAQVGIVSAQLGDRAAAAAAQRTLALYSPKYQRGTSKLMQAEVAAALGDRDQAVDLLRQGLELGLGLESLGGGLAGNPDLEPLFGYPRFEELLKPAG